MVDIHRISAGNVNCYIVVDNDKAILIDTGRKRYREKILDKCKEHHVRLIVLTHGHMDHCQNAAYLANALKIPVAMSKKDINILGKMVLLVSLSSFGKDTLDTFEPMVYLQNGDSLNEYGVDVKVIELPGHTKGSIGLAIEDKLFVGDALMNMFYPTISMLYTDEEKMLESAKCIGEMGEKTIYFGHGKPKRNRKWVK